MVILKFYVDYIGAYEDYWQKTKNDLDNCEFYSCREEISSFDHEHTEIGSIEEFTIHQSERREGNKCKCEDEFIYI